MSLGTYAQPSSTVWKNSMIKPAACCTLAEIVNRQNDFVYKGPPYFVVDKTEWIMWSACIRRDRHPSRAHHVNSRYLLVQTTTEAKPGETNFMNSSLTSGWHQDQRPPEEPKVGKYLVQQRGSSTSLGATSIDIPHPSYQLDKLVRACVLGRKDIILEAEDRAIFDGPQDEPSGSGANPTSSRNTNVTAETRYVPPHSSRAWKPDDKWIQRNAKELLPPPTESSLTASAALQREFRSIMREQNTALARNDLATLGWYLPPQHNEDNLYQWLVELHSFDPELPITKDMKSK